MTTDGIQPQPSAGSSADAFCPTCGSTVGLVGDPEDDEIRFCGDCLGDVTPVDEVDEDNFVYGGSD